MEISKQIKYERKKLNLSRAKFVESLYEKTELKVSEKKVQRWEEGELPDIIELQCLSEFFELKASDLLNKDKDPMEVTQDSLYEFGKKVYGNTQMDNIRDLMGIFYVTKQNRFESVPRYDIELQGVNSLLFSKNDYYKAIQFVDHFFHWVELGREDYQNDETKERIKLNDDNVGSRSYYDPRTILDAEEMILIKEGIASEIYWFSYEASAYLYERNKTSLMGGNYFVKKNIYT